MRLIIVLLAVVVVICLSVATTTAPKQGAAEAELIASIRANFAFFGYDTSELSDKELKEGIYRSSKIISESGFTADEAIRGLSLCSDLSVARANR